MNERIYQAVPEISENMLEAGASVVRDVKTREQALEMVREVYEVMRQVKQKDALMIYWSDQDYRR